jgi:lipid-A-disaccharide synthase
MGTKRNGESIWLSAGEVSGDMHGALLVRALRQRAPGVRCMGLAGSAMEEAGCEKVFDISELSLMGVTEVVAHLPRVLGLMRRIYARLKAERPRAVVCIDAPDFNFFVVRMARRLGIPVFYYICPQVWAWRKGRVNFLRDKVDRVLCILPFEKPFLAAHGLDADYVGHPLVDQIPFADIADVEPDPNRVLILPGSRRKEIESLYPDFLEAAKRMHHVRPELTFTVVRAPGVDRAALEAALPAGLPVTIEEPQNRYAAMRGCGAVIAASGTVALETALVGVPTVIAYRLSPVTYALGRLIVDVPYISLPNLIMDTEVFPELLQEDANPEDIAAKALGFLDARTNAEVRATLSRLAELVGEPGAPGRAADIILGRLHMTATDGAGA